MKPIYYLFLAACISLFACNNQDQFLSGGGEITANIDGFNFSADVSAAFLLDSTLQVGIFGTDPASIQLNEVYTEGEFVLNDGQGFVNNITLSLENGKQVSLSEGNYTITLLTNSKAEGSFEGTAYEITDILLANPYPVSQGTFKCNF